MHKTKNTADQEAKELGDTLRSLQNSEGFKVLLGDFLSKAAEKSEEEGVQEVENLMKEILSMNQKYGRENLEKCAIAELERITQTEYIDPNPEKQREAFDKALQARQKSEGSHQDHLELKERLMKKKKKQIEHYTDLLKKWGYAPENILRKESFCDIWFEHANHKYAIYVMNDIDLGAECGRFSIELPCFYHPNYDNDMAERINELHAMNNMASWTSGIHYAAKVYIEDNGCATAAIGCLDPYPIKTKDQMEIYLGALKTAVSTFKGYMRDWDKQGRKLFKDDLFREPKNA
jgi:hypothetical protein